MAAGDSALKLDPGNPITVNGKAISLYMFGRSGVVDTTDAALAMFKESAVRHPDFSDAIYNQAVISSERGREATAKELWNAFLAREQIGPYARIAIRHLGGVTQVTKPDKPVLGFESPIRLGEMNRDTEKHLKGMSRQSFSIGRTDIDIYDGKGLRLLAINGSIEVVESVLAQAIGLVAFKRQYGGPLRMVTTTAGKTLIYRNFVADLEDGFVRKVGHFEMYY